MDEASQVGTCRVVHCSVCGLLTWHRLIGALQMQLSYVGMVGAWAISPTHSEQPQDRSHLKQWFIVAMVIGTSEVVCTGCICLLSSSRQYVCISTWTPSCY